MIELSIPYGKDRMTARLAGSRCLGIFKPALPRAAEDEAAEVARALAAPIGSAPLCELARGKRNAVVIASDHTRPVPSRILMPQLLAELRKGAPGIDVTILIATGFHRGTTRDELVAKFGERIVEDEKIVIHDSTDDGAMVKLGTLPSGGELIINRLAVETDLLISEGFIEPHFFAGFSGGRKSVLPGIASKTTVLANHCSEFIRSPFARTGNLADNPLHCDMLYAAEQARLAFILNVVIDGEKRIVRAFAGDSGKAHVAGCEFLRGLAGVEVPEADIVITGNGGFPLDQNVYQAVKGMTAGEAVCREGGVIILCAACNDGHGGEAFYRSLAGAVTPHVLLAETAKVPRNETKPDQWEYQILARIRDRFRVIMVTRDCDHAMLRRMHLEAAYDLEEALEMAGEGSVAVIPDGVSVIAKRK